MIMRRVPQAVLVLAALAAAPAVQAQASNDWAWRATIYGWLPGVQATTRYDFGGGSIGGEVGPDNYLDNLKFVFFGELEARKGPWSVWADVVYLNFGNTETRLRDLVGPAGNLSLPINSNASSGVKGLLGTLAVGHVINQTPGMTVDVFGGARYLRLKTHLDWEFSGPVGQFPVRGGVASDKDLWDGIVGVRGRAQLGGNWFAPFHADIGAGSSKFTWQAMGGVGYRYSWGDIVLAYRHLSYELHSDRPISDVSFSGPLLAASFTF